MEKRILSYRKYIDELLQQTNVDWTAVIREHLIQVAFFQHERLIHLIVTVTFAILEVVVIGLCVAVFTLGGGAVGNCPAGTVGALRASLLYSGKRSAENVCPV